MKTAITYLELLEMVANDKAPRTISTEEGDTYIYRNGGYRSAEDDKSFDEDSSFNCYSTYGHTSVRFITYSNEILDCAEKQYLKAVIRPFKNRVQEIVKASLRTRSGENLEYLQIVVKMPDSCTNARINFPAFPKGKMYKGMEADKKYTVEDLGL